MPLNKLVVAICKNFISLHEITALINQEKIKRTANFYANRQMDMTNHLDLSAIWAGTTVALPFASFYRLEVPEQALGGIPLGFGIAVEDKPSELSYTSTSYMCSCFIN